MPPKTIKYTWENEDERRQWVDAEGAEERAYLRKLYRYAAPVDRPMIEAIFRKKFGKQFKLDLRTQYHDPTGEGKVLTEELKKAREGLGGLQGWSARHIDNDPSWKKLGVEAWKTTPWGFDPVHWYHRLRGLGDKGERDKANKGLQEYDAKDFGIDLALNAVAEGAGTSLKTMYQARYGQKALRKELQAARAAMKDGAVAQGASKGMLALAKSTGAWKAMEKRAAAFRKARGAEKLKYIGTHEHTMLKGDVGAMNAFEFAQQSYFDKEARTNLGDWILDKELSDVDTAIWENPLTHRVHISHRGTQTRDDVLTDVQMVLGTEAWTKRFAKALDLTRRAHEKYLDDIVEGSGHSLGGSLLQHATKRYGAEDWFGHGYTFNAGSSPASQTINRAMAIASSEKPLLDAKITHYDQLADVVSLSGHGFGDVNTFVSRADPFGAVGESAHSIDSFVDPTFKKVKNRPNFSEVAPYYVDKYGKIVTKTGAKGAEKAAQEWYQKLQHNYNVYQLEEAARIYKELHNDGAAKLAREREAGRKWAEQFEALGGEPTDPEEMRKYYEELGDKVATDEQLALLKKLESFETFETNADVIKYLRERGYETGPKTTKTKQSKHYAEAHESYLQKAAEEQLKVNPLNPVPNELNAVPTIKENHDQTSGTVNVVPLANGCNAISVAINPQHSFVGCGPLREEVQQGIATLDKHLEDTGRGHLATKRRQRAAQQGEPEWEPSCLDSLDKLDRMDQTDKTCGDPAGTAGSRQPRVLGYAYYPAALARDYVGHRVLF